MALAPVPSGEQGRIDMRVIVEKDIRVAMSDGVELACDVYRPESRDALPTLVERLPYNKEAPGYHAYPFDPLRGALAGYAVVVQDTRGRFASGGHFTPFTDEAADGADTVAWAATQPWSSGRVGMVGVSYFGATQWLAASRAPGPLRAIAPQLTSAEYYEGWTHQGGAFQLGFSLLWALRLALGEQERRMASGTTPAASALDCVHAIDRAGELYRHLPLNDMPLLEELAPYYLEWLAHPSRDEYWRATAPNEYYQRITVPALNIGGWHDIFLGGTIANYLGMRQRGGSEQARSLQRLIIGPWAHGAHTGTFAERDFGLSAGTETTDVTGMQLRWFDHLLKDVDNGVDREKPVRVFVQGANRWREEDEWPLPGTDYTRYFLRGEGRANTASGDGRLSLEAPGDEPQDAFLYDPRDPVPTVGGQTFLPGLFIAANAGPRDQRSVEGRHDVLCYTAPTLEQPLEVTGPVSLRIFASSTALDTDFTGKLVDVYPDGRAELVTDGILRARYRESTGEPLLLEPGRVYQLHIDLRATAYLFPAGHRVRLEVSSSNFPRFDRNSNTGGVVAQEHEHQPAINRVHHSRSYPSCLVLPVIRR